MVDEEETFGAVLALHRLQARVVRAPERVAPVLVEVVALQDVGAGLRRDLEEFMVGGVDGAGVAFMRLSRMVACG